MPSTVEYPVGHDKTYTTIAAAESASQGNLVSADEIREIVIYEESSGDKVWNLSATIEIAGATVDATRFRRIRAAASMKHTGTEATGVRLTQGTSRDVLVLNEDYVQVQDLEFFDSRAGIVCSYWDTRVGMVVERCILRDLAPASGSACIDDYKDSGAYTTIEVRNCLIYDNAASSGDSSGIRSRGAASGHLKVFNCTIDQAHFGTYGSGVTSGGSGANTLTNVVSTRSHGASGKDFDLGTSGTKTVTYCASEDATADDQGGAGNDVSITVADWFADPDGSPPDYRHKSGSPGIDGGTSVSGFSDDLIGTARSGTWDQGAFEQTTSDLVVTPAGVTFKAASSGSAILSDLATSPASASLRVDVSGASALSSLAVTPASAEARVGASAEAALTQLAVTPPAAEARVATGGAAALTDLLASPAGVTARLAASAEYGDVLYVTPDAATLRAVASAAAALTDLLATPDGITARLLASAAAALSDLATTPEAIAVRLGASGAAALGDLVVSPAAAARLATGVPATVLSDVAYTPAGVVLRFAVAATADVTELLLTIRERILRNLQATLESIQTANGFDHDMGEVHRVDRLGFRLRRYPAALIREVRADEAETLRGATDYQDPQLSVELGLWIRDFDEAPASDANALLMDVERALMVDPGRAGLALDTAILGNALAATQSAQPFAQHVVRVAIPYREDRNHPSKIDGVGGTSFGSFPITAPAKSQALSVRERAVRDLVAALEAIAAGAGYASTIEAVLRFGARPQNVPGFPSVVVAETGEAKREGGRDAPLGALSCDLDVALLLWARDLEPGILPQRVHEVLGDIRRAILADGRRGGNAVATRVLATRQEVDETGEPFGLYRVETRIVYRHDRLDPSRSR